MEGKIFNQKLFDNSISFQNNMKRSMPSIICGVCNNLKSQKEMKETMYSLKDEMLDIIYAEKTIFGREYIFRKADGSFDQHPSKYFTNIIDDKIYCCKSCFNQLKNKTIPKCSLANRFDFGVVPDELKDLNMLEERIISIYICITTICKLEKHADSQTGTYGGIAHLVNDVVSWAKILPRHPSQVDILLMDSHRKSTHQ